MIGYKKYHKSYSKQRVKWNENFRKPRIENFLLEQKGKERKINKIVFPYKTLVQATGMNYEELVSLYNSAITTGKVFYSAKGTKKSFNLALFIIWLKCNIEELNVLALRNTTATIMKSLVQTFKKAMIRLIKVFGIKDLQWILDNGDYTKSQFEKNFKWPNGTIIRFGAFEQADNMAGSDNEVGSFGVFFIDEPIAKNPSEHIDYEKQKEDYLMIKMSIFRGLNTLNGVHKVPYELDKNGVPRGYVDYHFQRQTLLSMNPWDDKHWITTDLVEPTISNEEWIEYVLQDIRNNKKMVRNKVIEVEVDGKIQKEKTMICKMTKLVNEFVDEQERLQDEVMLQRGDAYDLTSTLGFDYDGADPTFYVYRINMKNSLEKYEDIDFERYTIGIDFGVKDKTALTLIGWFTDEYGMIHQQLFPQLVFENSRKLNYDRLQISDLLISWFGILLEEVDDLYEKPCSVVYDEKGELTCLMIKKELQEKEFYNFKFNMSVKKGIPLILRQTLLQMLLDLGYVHLDWNEQLYLKKEMFNIMYDLTSIEDKGMQRDEKHFHVDCLNSWEYGLEPLAHLLIQQCGIKDEFSKKSLSNRNY